MIYLIFYIVIVVMCFTCINHMNKNLFSKGDKVDLPFGIFISIVPGINLVPFLVYIWISPKTPIRRNFDKINNWFQGE